MGRGAGGGRRVAREESAGPGGVWEGAGRSPARIWVVGLERDGGRVRVARGRHEGSNRQGGTEGARGATTSTVGGGTDR